MFSGIRWIETVFNRHNDPFLAYDKANDALTQHFSHVVGFITAINWFRRVRRHGVVTWATECSTWVWLCRASTGRTELNAQGFPTACVLDANRQVVRMCLCILFLTAMDVWNLLEQPASSVMEYFKQVVRLMLSLRMFRKHTWMGMFGHWLRKPTHLYRGVHMFNVIWHKIAARILCEINMNTCGCTCTAPIGKC